MADITISPIPYGGGTIQTVEPYHIAPLTSDYSLWVYFFQQTSPDYHVLGLAQVTPSVTDSSPTVTILNQRAFTGLLNNTDSDKFQLLTLSPTKIVLIKRGDLTSTISNLHSFHFFDIISNDFIYDGSTTIDSYIRSLNKYYYTIFVSYYDGTDYYLICPVKPRNNPSTESGKMYLKIFKNPDSTTNFYSNPFISTGYLFVDNTTSYNNCKINYWELRNKLLLVSLLTYARSVNKYIELYFLVNLEQAKINLLSLRGPDDQQVTTKYTPIVFPTSSNICYFQQSNSPEVISKLSAGISSVETGLSFINSTFPVSPYPPTTNYGGGEILGNNTFINYYSNQGPFPIKLFYMDETNQRVAESLETQGTLAYPITSSAGETQIFFQEGRRFGKIDTFTYIFGKHVSSTEPRWELKVKRLEAND